MLRPDIGATAPQNLRLLLTALVGYVTVSLQYQYVRLYLRSTNIVVHSHSYSYATPFSKLILRHLHLSPGSSGFDLRPRGSHLLRKSEFVIFGNY
jgi:hypothetical protein